jgi:hypothetical protein
MDNRPIARQQKTNEEVQRTYPFFRDKNMHIAKGATIRHYGKIIKLVGEQFEVEKEELEDSPYMEDDNKQEHLQRSYPKEDLPSLIDLNDDLPPLNDLGPMG